MLIAIDYDGTYTADPWLWNHFIEMAQHRGHRVVCVTMRYPTEIIDGMTCGPIDIVYTSRKAKALAFKADVWIDDSPQWLLQDSL